MPQIRLDQEGESQYQKLTEHCRSGNHFLKCENALYGKRYPGEWNFASKTAKQKNNIIFLDEATFRINGIVNKQTVDFGAAKIILAADVTKKTPEKIFRLA